MKPAPGTTAEDFAKLREAWQHLVDVLVRPLGIDLAQRRRRRTMYRKLDEAIADNRSSDPKLGPNGECPICGQMGGARLARRPGAAKVSGSAHAGISSARQPPEDSWQRTNSSS